MDLIHFNPTALYLLLWGVDFWLSSVEPRVELDDPCGSFSTKDILRFPKMLELTQRGLDGALQNAGSQFITFQRSALQIVVKNEVQHLSCYTHLKKPSRCKSAAIGV